MSTELLGRRQLLLWAPLLILAVSISAAADLTDHIARIDEKAKEIDRLQTDEVKKSLLTGTDGSGILSAFWHEGQIPHVKITIGMSNRRIEENFYYEKGELILATSRQSFFLWDEEKQKLDLVRTSNSIEDRYYFVGGKLQHWNTSRMAVNSNNEDSNIKQKEQTMLQQASLFLQTAHGKMDQVNIEMFIKQGE